MSARKFWLTIFISSIVLTGIVVTFAVVGGSKPVNKVDLEQVTDLYLKNARGNDLAEFEKALNEKKIYPPGDALSCVWTDRGAAVVCFVDRNSNKMFDKGGDEFVFKLEVQRDGARNYLIAGDGHHHYRHSVLGDVATWYLISSMYRGHYGFYGGWHAYPSHVWAGPGYYRSTYGAGGRGGGGRSRSGGWGGGK